MSSNPLDTPTLNSRDVQMVVRSRSLAYLYVRGGKAVTKTAGLVDNVQGPATLSKTMIDTIGNKQGVNMLDLSIQRPVIGSYTGRTQEYTCTDYYFSRWLEPLTVPNQPSDASVVTSGLARTNPSRPYVDPGLLIQDLKDLPQMLLDIGTYIKSKDKRPSAKMVANGYLSWNFGWMPLVGDLVKLVQFQTAVEKRKAELQSLRTKGLHRTYTAFTGTWPWKFESYFPVFYGGCPYWEFVYETTTKKWMSVDYKLSAPPPPMDASGLDETARNLVGGMNLSASTLWDLMPWSWMIDWFSNVGDILAATRNVLGTETSNICVMTHTTTQLKKVTRLDNGPWHGNFKVAPGANSEFKKRSVGFFGPSLELKLPFLDGGQLSILSALAVQRNRGR